MILHIDFETRSTVDLKKCGADVYAAHPTSDVLCMGYAFEGGPVELWANNGTQEFPLTVQRHITQDGVVVAHNAPFELVIWNNTLRRKLNAPTLRPEQVHCTMAMSYAMALPGSLERAAAAVGIEQQKDMQGSRVMMQLAQPREVKPDGTVIWWEDKEKLERLYAYCKQDIEVERELYKRLFVLSEQEHHVWLTDYRINQRGVAVDLPAVKAAIELVKYEKDRLDKEMRKVTGNAVATCTATGQLTYWLKSKGVDVDGVAKADVIELLSEGYKNKCRACEGSGETLVSSHVDPRDYALYDGPCKSCNGVGFKTLPAECKLALRLRQEAAKSSTAKLEAMMNSAGRDGRIRGIFQYHGAATGRWAGRRIQPQNFPRPKLSQEEIEEVFKILGGVQ